MFLLLLVSFLFVLFTFFLLKTKPDLFSENTCNYFLFFCTVFQMMFMQDIFSHKCSEHQKVFPWAMPPSVICSREVHLHPALAPGSHRKLRKDRRRSHPRLPLTQADHPAEGALASRKDRLQNQPHHHQQQLQPPQLPQQHHHRLLLQTLSQKNRVVKQNKQKSLRRRKMLVKGLWIKWYRIRKVSPSRKLLRKGG